MLIVDAHLDLAYNALEDGRNPLQTVQQLRSLERESFELGRASVSFPQLKEAGVALVFGTIFVMPADSPVGQKREHVYRDPDTAHQLGMQQLDFYRRLVDVEENHLRLVGNQAELEEVLASHQGQEQPLLGIVPLMEGADPVRTPEELELWVERGVRLIGLAWDDTRYAPGAWRGSSRGLTKEGRALLEAMSEFQLILDITHMNERASLEALDQYAGPVAASHSNCRVLVPGERQISDAQIRALGERDGVIGIVMYNSFLLEGYKKGSGKELVTLDHIVAHIDHICQTLGSADHVGLGTDMDGGFGAGDIPTPLDSSADLPLIATQLQSAGYTEQDINQIMGLNWINLLRRSWALRD